MKGSGLSRDAGRGLCKNNEIYFLLFFFWADLIGWGLANGVAEGEKLRRQMKPKQSGKKKKKGEKRKRKRVKKGSNKEPWIGVLFTNLFFFFFSSSSVCQIQPMAHCNLVNASKQEQRLVIGGVPVHRPIHVKSRHGGPVNSLALVRPFHGSKSQEQLLFGTPCDS